MELSDTLLYLSWSFVVPQGANKAQTQVDIKDLQ